VFVRWKQRRNRTRRNDCGGVSTYAYLVKSERIDGKPRLKVIGYVGTVPEGGERHDWRRIRFWGRVDALFARLKLDPDTRASIEHSLATRVPRPLTEEEREEQSRAVWKRIREDLRKGKDLRS
jgi:hypothetical protein